MAELLVGETVTITAPANHSGGLYKAVKPDEVYAVVQALLPTQLKTACTINDILVGHDVKTVGEHHIQICGATVRLVVNAR